MTELQAYRKHHLPGLAEIWNQTFNGGPNFMPLDERDLLRRVVNRPSFDPANLLAATSGDRVLGFVHFGPRTNYWFQLSERHIDREEAQIYVTVAPDSDQPLLRDLLQAGLARAVETGAGRVLLGPSWVHGAQPFYNTIAGAYEFPGLSLARQSLLDVAGDAGFAPLAEYGTPEIDCSDREHLHALDELAREVQGRAAEWGLRLRVRPLPSGFFAGRDSVELVRGSELVAATAHGLWAEYSRHYGRRLFGITSVHVAPRWRGKGLGKLIVIRAIEAARDAGAEGVHLHVWRGNEPAWSLYHRALGFKPKYRWVTLAKRLPGRASGA